MLRFRFVERKDMSQDAEEGAKLYYPQLVSNGRVSFEALCDEVAEQSSLTSGDIKNCVDRLVNCLVRHLQEGRTVDCGDIGSFYVVLRSSGSATKEGYDTTTQMREPKVVYNPGKDLKTMKKTEIKFERIGEKDEEDGSDDEGTGAIPQA